MVSLAEPGREARVISAKQALEGKSPEWLALATPLLHLSLRDLRELAQVAVALGQVRDHGYGEVRARFSGNQMTLLELVLQHQPLTERVS